MEQCFSLRINLHQPYGFSAVRLFEQLLYRLVLGPLFELGLPVFVGGREELEPVVAERPSLDPNFLCHGLNGTSNDVAMGLTD
jgi:hypothetical protein